MGGQPELAAVRDHPGQPRRSRAAGCSPRRELVASQASRYGSGDTTPLCRQLQRPCPRPRPGPHPTRAHAPPPPSGPSGILWGPKHSSQRPAARSLAPPSASSGSRVPGCGGARAPPRSPAPTPGRPGPQSGPFCAWRPRFLTASVRFLPGAVCSTICCHLLIQFVFVLSVSSPKNRRPIWTGTPSRRRPPRSGSRPPVLHSGVSGFAEDQMVGFRPPLRPALLPLCPPTPRCRV